MVRARVMVDGGRRWCEARAKVLWNERSMIIVSEEGKGNEERRDVGDSYRMSLWPCSALWNVLTVQIVLYLSCT